MPIFRSHLTTPSRRRVLVTVASALVLTLALGACRVNSVNLFASDKLAPGSPESAVPSREGVAYGPDPMQKIDIHLPTNGANVGTIVYFHAGGWISGSREQIAPIVLAERARGWAIVSVEYRLAPAVRAPQLLADADRALRFVRANGAGYGLNTSTIVSAGASAGGHIATMMGAAYNQNVDPTLPAKLASTSPKPDAVINLVGPSDLTTLWQAGGWAPGLIDDFLGCTMGGSETTLPRCDIDYARRYSPAFWAALSAYFGTKLMPIYMAYGPWDTLVRVDTQGDVLYQPWQIAGGDLATWYETPEWGGHNIAFDMNKTAFDIFLNKVRDRAF